MADDEGESARLRVRVGVRVRMRVGLRLKLSVRESSGDSRGVEGARSAPRDPEP